MVVKDFYTYKDKWDAAIRRKIECMRGTPTKEHHVIATETMPVHSVFLYMLWGVGGTFHFQSAKFEGGNVTGASSVQTSDPDSRIHT